MRGAISCGVGRATGSGAGGFVTDIVGNGLACCSLDGPAFDCDCDERCAKTAALGEGMSSCE